MVSVFCRNCGKDLEPNSKVCLSCGVAPPKGDKYCQNCGNEVSPLTDLCVKCGVPLAHVSVKSKTVSVVLAVLLTYWTWLYTYKRDKKKFWIAFSVTILLTVSFTAVYISTALTSSVNAIISATSVNIWDESSILFAWVILGQVVGAIILIWAVVDTVKKPQSWYDKH